MFRAHDPENDRPVAVKLFTVDLAPELVHQFVADLDRLVAAELTHPAIARPIASGILGNSPYLVEEFVEAESLDIALRLHGRAPVPDALRIATQIAGALDFAAVSHMHHGALHPRDVLLSTNDVRITGIGVARMLEQVGITAPTRRPYAAPERVAGSVWHRFADIFSLAALVYEMLWGRRLNGAGVQAVATLEPLPGGDLTALSLAFSRALAEDPGGRYSRALKFVEALKNAFPSEADTDAIRESHAFPPPGEIDAPPPVPESPVVLLPPSPGTATFVLPAPVVEAESDVDLQAAPEPQHEVEEAVPPTPETAVLHPRATTLPFEVGPRRRDRQRYGEPPEDVQIDRHADAASVDEADSDLPTVPLPERSRSAIWPIALALILGVALAGGIGFLGGYWKGFSDSQTPVASAGEAASATPAREYTDSAVPEAPKPLATAAAAPDAPAAPAATPPAPATPPASANPSAVSPAAREPAPRNPTPRDPAVAQKGTPTAAQIGRILVRSTPAGAQVAVDGREYGVTPVIVRDLALGTHTVRVARDGFTAEERQVRITRSRPSQPMEVTLTAPRSAAAAAFTGGLSVDSRPAGAKVFLDGHLVGLTPLQSHAVSAGEHAIRLEHDGYRQWTSAVRILSNEQNRVTASLER